MPSGFTVAQMVTSSSLSVTTPGRNHRIFLFSERQDDGEVFGAGGVAGGIFREAGDAEAGAGRRVSLRPVGEVFDGVQNREAVVVRLDRIVPGDLHIEHAEQGFGLVGVGEVRIVQHDEDFEDHAEIGARLVFCFIDRYGIR